MARVRFTQHLLQHVDAQATEAVGATVREALDGVFQANPRLRSYVLDDQSRLRKHVVVFVNGRMVRDRLHLTDPIEPDSELFVMQALSGG